MASIIQSLCPLNTMILIRMFFMAKLMLIIESCITTSHFYIYIYITKLKNICCDICNILS